MEEGPPCALLVGMQIGAATVENSTEFPQQIKKGSPFWPSNPTSGNLSKETQNINLKEYMHPYIHCSVMYNSQDLEAAQVSISRCVDKTAMVYLYNEILLGSKKEVKFTLCDSMNGPGEHSAKWNKPVRERQVLYNLPCMWNLMNKLN